MPDSFNYCGICGHIPKQGQQPNQAPVKWWDPDDGWKIGTLCSYCLADVEHVKPKSTDFAYRKTNGIADDINTDEDVIELIQHPFNESDCGGVFDGSSVSSDADPGL